MNPWLILGFVVAVVAATGTGYLKGHSAGKAEVQAAWDVERVKQEQAHAKALQEVLEKQQKLQMGADQLRQEKEREIKKIADVNRVLLHSLRDRPERPAQTSPVSSAASARPAGCGGKDLYREDAEFLVQLATEGDQLRAALKQCYTQYNAARQAVK